MDFVIAAEGFKALKSFSKQNDQCSQHSEPNQKQNQNLNFFLVCYILKERHIDEIQIECKIEHNKNNLIADGCDKEQGITKFFSQEKQRCNF